MYVNLVWWCLSNRLRALTRSFFMVYLQWLRSIRLKCQCGLVSVAEATKHSLAFLADLLRGTVGWRCRGWHRLRRACTRNHLVRSRTAVRAAYWRFPHPWPLLRRPLLSLRSLMRSSNLRFHHRSLPLLRYFSAKRSFFSFLISYWWLTSLETVFMMIPVFVSSTVDQMNCRVHQTTSIF